MILVQKWPFFQFFLPNIGQENVFLDILEEKKNAFLGYNNKKLKKSKNGHFCKGVKPWFRSKNGHFPIFFLRQYRLEKFILWYCRTKKRLSRLYKKKDQKLKNWHFSNGVSLWFWSKNGHFPNFFFLRQYRLGKCILWYSRTKKRFFSL